MSFFTVKEIWRSRGGGGSGEGEVEGGDSPQSLSNSPPVYDKASLSCCQIPLSGTNTPSYTSNSTSATILVTGGLNGVLKVWVNEGGANARLLLETRLKGPILQVMVTSESTTASIVERIQLTILFSNSLTTYSLNIKTLLQTTPTTDHAHTLLQKTTDMSLDQPAHSFITGSFGDPKGTTTCVQSFNGHFTFFTNNAKRCVWKKNHMVVPGVMKALSMTGNLLIATPDMKVEVFRLADIYEFCEQEGNNEGNSPGLRDDVLPIWTFVIGETIYDITIGDHILKKSTEMSHIIIMSEFHITALTEWGDLIHVIPLPSPPICGVLFAKKSSLDKNLIVMDHGRTIRVYSDLNLVWAAKLECVPVMVLVENFGTYTNMIIALYPDGTLCAHYLGTELPNVLPGVTSEKVTNQDLLKLSAIEAGIRDNALCAPPESVDKSIRILGEIVQGKMQNASMSPKFKLTITLESNNLDRINDVHVSFGISPLIHFELPHWHVKSLDMTSPKTKTFATVFWIKPPAVFIQTLKATVVYKHPGSEEMRIVVKDFGVPVNAFGTWHGVDSFIPAAFPARIKLIVPDMNSLSTLIPNYETNKSYEFRHISGMNVMVSYHGNQVIELCSTGYEYLTPLLVSFKTCNARLDTGDTQLLKIMLRELFVLLQENKRANEVVVQVWKQIGNKTREVKVIQALGENDGRVEWVWKRVERDLVALCKRYEEVEVVKRALGERIRGLVCVVLLVADWDGTKKRKKGWENLKGFMEFEETSGELEWEGYLKRVFGALNERQVERVILQ